MLNFEDELNKERKDFVIRHLRRASYKWPERSKAKNKTRVARGFYKCNLCGLIVHYKQIQLDHIQPIIDPEKGWISFDNFVIRLLCVEGGLQVLCKPCHAKKTKQENQLRKRNRKGIE